MIRSHILLPVALCAILVSCSPSREKRIERITSLEQRLFNSNVVSLDREKADSLMTMYEDFIRKFPKDTAAPGYLFKEARVAMNKDDGGKAIFLFDKYLSEYPEGKDAAVSMFLKGFVYENKLQELDKARETYLIFIEKYPSHQLVQSAQLALKMLGKSPDMIVKEFEAQRKADSALKARRQ